MRTDLYDVVVVGAGMAGLTAASYAAEQGQRVAVASIGAGAFVLGSGGVEERETLALQREPDFTYAMDFFLTLAEAAGTALAGDLQHTMLLPTLLGNFLPVQFAPLSVAHAALNQTRKTRVVGLHGLTGFDARFLAERFRSEAAQHHLPTEYEAITIDPGSALGMPVSTLRVAQAFDRDAAFRTHLADVLRAVKGDADRLLLPAVLGIESSDTQRTVFEEQVGCTVGELPTLPPSIPGLRLAHSLQQRLRSRGVVFLDGYPVERLQLERGLCTGLHIASPGRGFRVAGECVVLASSSALHRLLEGPVNLDLHHRPLHPNGSPHATNLFAACLPGSHPSELRGLASRIVAGHRAALAAWAERGACAAR